MVYDTSKEKEEIKKFEENKIALLHDKDGFYSIVYRAGKGEKLTEECPIKEPTISEKVLYLTPPRIIKSGSGDERIITYGIGISKGQIEYYKFTYKNDETSVEKITHSEAPFSILNLTYTPYPAMVLASKELMEEAESTETKQRYVIQTVEDIIKLSEMIFSLPQQISEEAREMEKRWYSKIPFLGDLVLGRWLEGKAREWSSQFRSNIENPPLATTEDFLKGAPGDCTQHTIGLYSLGKAAGMDMEICYTMGYASAGDGAIRTVGHSFPFRKTAFGYFIYDSALGNVVFIQDFLVCGGM